MTPRDAIKALRAMADGKETLTTKDVLDILDAVPDDGVPSGISDFEQRVREELARVAPIGTPNTPEVQARVKRHMSRFLTEELTKLGFPQFLAVMIGAGLNLKPREGV